MSIIGRTPPCTSLPSVHNENEMRMSQPTTEGDNEERCRASRLNAGPRQQPLACRSMASHIVMPASVEPQTLLTHLFCARLPPPQLTVLLHRGFPASANYLSPSFFSLFLLPSTPSHPATTCVWQACADPAAAPRARLPQPSPTARRDDRAAE